MIKLYLIFVLIVVTAAIVVSRQLPWWGASLLIAGTFIFLFYGTIKAIKIWFRGAMRKSMDMASMALRGATITVHGVAHAPPPPSHQRLIEEEQAAREEGESPDGEQEAPDLTPHRYIAVDMTVQPLDDAAAVTTPALAGANGDAEEGEDDVTKTWNPQTFTLVPIDSTIDPKRIRLMDFAAMQATVAHVEHLDVDGSVIWSAPVEDDEYADDVEPAEDGYPYQIRGPIRLRLTFGVPRDMPARAKIRYLLEEFTQISIPPA